MKLTARRLFAAVLFIALFILTVREISDPDFWWHLRTGQYIVSTGTVPRVDVFSGTVAGRPWVAHEWLSEVILFALFTLGSYPLLILAFSAITALSFAFVYARCAGRPYVAALAVLLAALASAPTWGVRPQMISLLLTCIFLWVLEKSLATAGVDRRLWLLVPLMLVWVNLHSGFALGLAILAIHFVGEFAKWISGRLKGADTGVDNLRHLGLVLAACLLIVPVNPNGATMYVYPFETLTSRAMQTYIQEWFSPDFHLVEFQPFAWLLLATLAAVGLSGQRLSLTQVLLLVVFGYAGLRSARNIPIFAVIAAPVLAEHLWAIFESRGWARFLAPRRLTYPPAPPPLRAASGISSPKERGADAPLTYWKEGWGIRSILNALVLCLVLAAGLARLAIVFSNQTAIEQARYPAAAVDFLQAQKVGGTIYNSYGWGGYLIWRLYPTANVFVDGRADVYGDVFIEEYLNAYRGDASWQALLDRYSVKTILLEPDAQLVAAIAADGRWKRVYADKQAVVWER